MLVKCMKTSTSRPYIQYVWNIHYAFTQIYWPIKLYFYRIQDTILFTHTVFSILPTIFNSQSDAFKLFF